MVARDPKARSLPATATAAAGTSAYACRVPRASPQSRGRPSETANGSPDDTSRPVVRWFQLCIRTRAGSKAGRGSVWYSPPLRAVPKISAAIFHTNAPGRPSRWSQRQLWNGALVSPYSRNTGHPKKRKTLMAPPKKCEIKKRKYQQG